ncbi:MAG: DUF5597 domain-containing protein [Tannerellaceae bacterium]|jgi:hypothetical protein|nr:DUF5597 domain-containing protein [Tannerellaceae bacterium]
MFDFYLVDGLIKKAREHDLKLVLLWFGSWKNGLSHYVPSWVKMDNERFHKVILDNGKATETLSPFGLESGKADANAIYAIGRHNGIGYSPFGIDGSRGGNSSQTALANAYQVLGQLMPVITDAQSENRITAFTLSTQNNQFTEELGGYKVTVSLSRNGRTGAYLSERGYGMVIWEKNNDFIIAGSNIIVTFIPDSPGPRMAGFLSVYEGEYVDGTWKSGRLLNGDNIMVNYDVANESLNNRTGTGVKLGSDPSILKIKLYRFE